MISRPFKLVLATVFLLLIIFFAKLLFNVIAINNNEIAISEENITVAITKIGSGIRKEEFERLLPQAYYVSDAKEWRIKVTSKPKNAVFKKNSSYAIYVFEESGGHVKFKTIISGIRNY